jgi:transposase
MGLQPPPPEVPRQQPDPRDLPRAQAAGAFGNKPPQERAQRVGFRMQAPKRGANRQGVGTIRNAVERCHHFFAQCGRIFRRVARSAGRYCAWIEMAAQFIGVCSSVKTCEIGENLLSISDPISGPQERLIHASALVPPPALQC